MPRSVVVRKKQNPFSAEVLGSQQLQPMQTDGQDFLERLANVSPNGFERKFAETSNQLGLGGLLAADELNLLYEAAFYSTLCNIAFNGLGGCAGAIKPERESTRIKLEQGFMAARGNFFACRSWKKLHAEAKASVRRTFLNVFILEENLAK